MKITDISRSFYDVVDARINEAENHKEWQKKAQTVDKAEHEKWKKKTQNVDKKEHEKWKKDAGIDEDSELLNKPTLSVKELAKKHNCSPEKIVAQLKKGIAIELEHTSDKLIAKEIALDHLAEFPDYYDRLAKVEEDNLDESPLVVSHPDAIVQAIARTQKWLEQVIDNEHDIEDLNLLGNVVGFHVTPRGTGNKIMFQDKGK